MVAEPVTGSLPKGPGTYILVLDLPGAHHLPAKRWSSATFEGGCYLYVGSALGGLSKRLSRYFRTSKRKHWHIDDLLECATIQEIWYLESVRRQECAWAARLARTPGIAPTRVAFGATDCRCRTHLFHAKDRPSPTVLGIPQLARWVYPTERGTS